MLPRSLKFTLQLQKKKFSDNYICTIENIRIQLTNSNWVTYPKVIVWLRDKPSMAEGYRTKRIAITVRLLACVNICKIASKQILWNFNIFTRNHTGICSSYKSGCDYCQHYKRPLIVLAICLHLTLKPMPNSELKQIFVNCPFKESCTVLFILKLLAHKTRTRSRHEKHKRCSCLLCLLLVLTLCAKSFNHVIPTCPNSHVSYSYEVENLCKIFSFYLYVQLTILAV